MSARQQLHSHSSEDSCEDSHGHSHRHSHRDDHGDSHAHCHTHPVADTGDSHAHAHADCCAAQPATRIATADGALLLHVPAMDCPTEEAQIRRVLERFTDIRRLSFDLSGRALAVEAPQGSWPQVVQAINAAGFSAGAAPWPSC